jgi:hypothetical protein
MPIAVQKIATEFIVASSSLNDTHPSARAESPFRPGEPSRHGRITANLFNCAEIRSSPALGQFGDSFEFRIEFNHAHPGVRHYSVLFAVNGMEA